MQAEGGSVNLSLKIEVEVEVLLRRFLKPPVFLVFDKYLLFVSLGLGSNYFLLL